MLSCLLLWVIWTGAYAASELLVSNCGNKAAANTCMQDGRWPQEKAVKCGGDTDPRKQDSRPDVVDNKTQNGIPARPCLDGWQTANAKR